jgi:capsular polysaccharide biosynthesis protein/predicted Ser/Thr protein kinase
MKPEPKCPQCGTALPAGVLEGLCPTCLLKQGAASDSATQGGPVPFEPPPVEELAKLFPKLEILKLIGKGGMGAIYKARQPDLDRVVALKILPPQRPGGPDLAERFNREARALARLTHPHIVAVHEFGQVNGLRYFLMEYVDGVNLRQLQRAEHLSPREALQIVPQICDALQYAHDEGVVHRDIKPENVLVDRKGRVKIADFGLAKILGLEPDDLRLTCEGQVMGTPHYMAPEQIEHPLEVDHRADIYALGVVFYELLTGELPLGKFAAPSRKVQVDVRLDEVVLRALEKEPERRFQHANQVKTAVETIAASPVPLPSPLLATAAAPSGLGRAKGGMKAALVAGTVVFILVLAAATLTTWLLPASYCSVARILVDKAAAGGVGPAGPAEFDPYFLQTAFEAIQSQLVLSKVMDQLNLGARWAPRYGTQQLTGPQVLAVLRKQLAVRQVPNSGLIEIRAFSPDREEAAELANAIAENYRSARPEARVRVVDRAEPALRPIRPNKPLNLFLGAAAGLVLGGCAAGVAFLTRIVCGHRIAGSKLEPAAGSLMGAWIGLGVIAALGLALVAGWYGCHSGPAEPNVIVTGTVTDASTGRPIAQARVSDNRYNAAPDRAPQEAWTDANGRFELHTWYEEHSISASAAGYTTSLGTLLTKPWRHEPVVHLNFQLQPATQF